MADATDAIIDIGTVPTGTVVAEDGSIRVTSSGAEYSRTFTEFQDEDQAVYAVRATNPVAQIDLEAEIITSVADDLSMIHPGEKLSTFGASPPTTLANYTAANNGFDPSVGAIYNSGASRAGTETEAPTINLTFQHRPHIV
jgi:hypothetical protein